MGAAISAAFLAYALPPYLTLDPRQSRLPITPDFPAHYWLLVAHIACGTIAIATAPLQVWGRLRRRRPAVHRFLGRVYVFAGVIPAALLSFGIMPVSLFPPGNLVTGVMWLAATTVAYVHVRKRRFAQHRRWMIYSVALTYSIVWGRLVLTTLPLVPGYSPSWAITAGQTATWIGFTLNLLLAQWWLERTARRPVPAAGRR
ncbi:DUF2306 domain-containing protein [Amycolatopsis rubida]|uniref:DUF2306 domain-containing protein n=1 Tax=Amycolatopsis rubida TaxID=112413 RepID=A0ABX0BJY3_9PSEU|nr:DUF2306 domain-containing protein [Amycolatopsis rubida]NEC55650.1 DUF2306 domain-containing protein [Amycolatopsis rubida]